MSFCRKSFFIIKKGIPKSNGFRPNSRIYYRNFHQSISKADLLTSTFNDNNNKPTTAISNLNNIFIPNNCSLSNLSSIYLHNLSILNTKIGNANVSKSIIHFKSLNDYIEHLENTDILPKSGSFVHFENKSQSSHEYSNNFGIILNDLNFSLSNILTYKVLLPNGEIIEVQLENIKFTLPKFIKRDLMKKFLLDDSVLPIDNLIHLTYILNVFLLFFIKIANLILSSDLIRTIYLKDALLNYQSSLHLPFFTDQLYNYSKSLRNHLNIKSNPLSCHALLLSCHFLLYNDPIHFRFINSNNSSIFNVLNPLNQLTTKYFKNPILLSQNLENIYVQPNDLIIKSYYDIMKRSNNFQIYNILKNDENFKRLILLVKYAIINPNPKILSKLIQILPLLNNTINPTTLFNFLMDLGIYDKNTNPIISSGIYGLNANDSTDLSLMVKNINELQYSSNKDVPIEKLPKRIQNYRPLKHIDESSDFDKGKESSFTNKNYSDTFLELIHKCKIKFWSTTSKSKYRNPVYKLSDTIAFSVNQESLTNYQFNIFLPIPNQSPNEHITIQEPIRVSNNLQSFPKLDKFHCVLRIDQPCIKLTFNHNLIDSTSLTTPDITVELDMFKKIEKIDENWFQNRNASNLQGSKKKMNCWLSMNKLLNLLIEKEKSRIRSGYLKTFKNLTESDKNIINFKTFFIDNQATTTINSKDDNSSHEQMFLRNKQWIIENLQLLVDENLSKFCLDNNIKVVSRCINKSILNSTDYRVFKKFKIFKWYSNTYETFNFQLSSNPGDMTAFVGCLSFLSNCKIHFSDNVKNFKNQNKDIGYLPLGIKQYSSFTSLNFIETHLNQWQLFRFLAIKSFEFINRKNIFVDKREKEKMKSIKWNPYKLDKVTNEHFKKCLSQTEGYIELINRMNRFESLRRIETDISGGTNMVDYALMRCIVTKIYANKIIGYWFEKDIEVEIQINNLENKVTIGDRLLCSDMVDVNAVNNVIILK